MRIISNPANLCAHNVILHLNAQFCTADMCFCDVRATGTGIGKGVPFSFCPVPDSSISAMVWKGTLHINFFCENVTPYIS